MFFRRHVPDPSTVSLDPARLADLEGQLAAINRSQAVIEFDLDGNILRANPNFCAALGYDEAEIRGRHHSMFVPEAERDDAYRAFWQKLGRGEYDAGQYRRLGKAGREVWIQASYNPVLGPDGKPFKVVKFATDITTQVKLREQAALLELVTNETDNSVIVCDARGLIEYTNPGFSRLTGYAAEEVKGKKPGDVLQGRNTDQDARRRIREKLDAGQPFYEEILNYKKSGEPYWISLAVNPVRDATGRVARFVSIQTDITETKRQQIDFNTRLDAISRSSAVIEFKPDGTVLYANENFCATVGYALDEIKGKHHRLFVDAEYAASPEYRAFWDKLGRGEFESGKFRRIGKGGREIWIQATYNPILDEDGKVVKVIKFASDVTVQELQAREQAQLVAEATRVMSAIAAGALTETMDGDYSSEFARLKDSVNSSVATLRDMVRQIDESATSIKSSASEIATGNQDLSQRTEEQASSLEETASAMEELASTVDQNADHARRGNELAAAAREQAERGGSVVTTAIAAMAEINQSSRKIAEIIGVIDELAFQTNLLALNAAVEAARAGDQGRGFAVVAAEVRNLAQRSAGAAREIKALINDSSSKVEQGSKLVNETGASLTEIVQSTKTVSTIIAEIALASQEQSSGIAQVNKAVTQMEQVVQQNAALVEEAAAASEAMDEQSRKLAELMRFFRMDGVATASPSAPPVERRGAQRPWSKPAAPAPLARAAGDDTDWSEF